MVYGEDGSDVLFGGACRSPGRATSTRFSVVGAAVGAHDAEGTDLLAGQGVDELFGGNGDDRLSALARDGEPDRITCGDGEDVALLERGRRHRRRDAGAARRHV